MKLDAYNKKRNFKKTPEPQGKISSKYKNLYVVQKHAASHLHYDFRLELNGVLLSWAIPKGPCLDPTAKRLAMQTDDHPVEYGGFEGIIPEGEYGGGTVMLWDTGKWIAEDDNPVQAYRKGHLRFTLEGKKLKGHFSLIRFKDEDRKSWFLVKGKDKYARSLADYDITVAKPNSVLTRRTLEGIRKNFENVWSKKGLVKRKKSSKTSKRVVKKKIDLSPYKLKPARMPAVIYPELATLVDEAGNDTRYMHEIKFDGYRILSFSENGEVRLMSRNNKDWTAYFPDIKKAIKRLSTRNLIFDGEVIVLDKDKKSNFQLLQNAIGSANQPFIYYIFDIIYFDKFNLKSLPLIERKSILKQILPNDSDILRYSDHIIGHGKEIFKKSCQMGLEGVMAKDINSPYEEKRTRRWLKVKCVKRQEFVIGGFTPPEGSRSSFGSLYLGYYENNKAKKLKFCGNVGTGFNQKSLRDIYSLLKKNISKENPFDVRPKGITTATWVKPVLVAEVEFTEWTGDGCLRHPAFKGLRTDKKVRDIGREKVVRLAEKKL